VIQTKKWWEIRLAWLEEVKQLMEYMLDEYPADHGFQRALGSANDHITFVKLQIAAFDDEEES